MPKLIVSDTEALIISTALGIAKKQWEECALSVQATPRLHDEFKRYVSVSDKLLDYIERETD